MPLNKETKPSQALIIILFLIWLILNKNCFGAESLLLLPLLFFYEGSFGIKYPMKVDITLNKETKPSQAIIIILSLVLLHLNKTTLEMNHFC